MALRNIVLEGDEILRKRCKEVTDIDNRIHMILDDMIDTMREQNGIGIAAPQIGIMRRMFVIEPEEGEVIEFINPEILESSGVQTGEEGCLSIPGYVGTVDRPEYIKIEALNRHGKKIVHEAREMKAIVISHEFDHLEGILYTDKAEGIREASADPEEHEEK